MSKNINGSVKDRCERECSEEGLGALLPPVLRPSGGAFKREF